MSENTNNNEKQKEAPVWTPYFFLIVLIMFTSYISFHGLNSGTSVYIDRTGGTAQFAGILASLYSISASIARFFMGPVIDEKGRAFIMRAGAVSFALGALLVALLPSDIMLIIGRILQGIGFGALTTSAAAAAADVLPKSRLGEGMSYYTLGNALAQSVGPAVGLFLVAMDPPEIMYFVLAIVAIIVFVLAVICKYEKDPSVLPETSSYRIRMEAEAAEDAPKKKETAKGIMRYIEPRAMCGGFPMMFMASANCFSVFFAGLYGQSLGVINGGIYFTFSAVSMVAVRAISKSYMDRVLPIINLGISVVAGLIGLTALLLATPESSWLFYLGGFMYGVELGITLPCNQTVAIKNTPDDRWGAGNAMFSILMDLGVVIFSIVWGSLHDMFGFSAPIMGAMCCMVVAMILGFLLYPTWAKSPAAWEEKKRETQQR